LPVPFNPPRAPSIGLVEEVSPRVISVVFGDGYSQDCPDGINTVLATMPVTWNRLAKEEADAIFDFFRALAGVERFTYRIPGETRERLWVCRSWRRTWLPGGKFSIAAQWQEVVL
jgi:phage-related protein